MTRLGTAVIVALAAAAAAAPAAGQARGRGAAVPGCDRECLAGIADTCLAAVAAHDPARAPMAPNARFTENAQVIAPGEGLWKTATEAPSTFEIYVPDPVSGLDYFSTNGWSELPR